mgnify:CR=1 FL=1
MTTFKKEHGDWKQYRKLPGVVEFDLHFSKCGPRQIEYMEAMVEVWDVSFKVLRNAYEKNMQYVLYTHGWTTSRPGRTTARSQVRKLMRSKEATPYIDRARCIQHESVFVAAIKLSR